MGMVMARAVMYTIMGYLGGSVLFARFFASLLNRGDILSRSADGNPGTANAFVYGGFGCGILTLCGDLLKGFLPVYLYLRGMGIHSCGIGLVFVMAAPVIGHIFPIFYGFRGGKGIAVSFGSLLGLAPDLRPAFVLAAAFLFFSLVIRVTPHYSRTIWAYRSAAVCMALLIRNIYIVAAFGVMAFAIDRKLQSSDEKKERCQVRMLWRH